MNEMEKIKAAAGLMFLPVHISGVVNLLAYPSPDIVKQSQAFPAKRDRVELQMLQSYTSQVLHTDTIIQHGNRTSLQVRGCVLSMPEQCVVCNREAVDHGILEVPGPVKLTYGKMTISGNNAARVWDAIQRDRDWFALPVCKDHKSDFHQHVEIKQNTKDQLLEIKLPNKAWAEEFIAMNPVQYAVFKNEEYLRKFRWAITLLYFGILGLAVAIALTFTKADWIWLIPTLALTFGGVFLLFKNRFKILVAEKSDTTDGSSPLPKWLEGVVSFKSLKSNLSALGFTLLILGAILAFVEFNGKSIAWPVTVSMLGAGALFALISMIMGKKKKKK